MASPNPSGRPKGIIDKRQRISQALMENAAAIIAVVIEAAKEKDMSAASLVLSRIAPALRNQSERVTFDFDAKAPLGQQMEAVLQAVADGHVAPDVGKQIMEGISALAGIRQVDDQETRLRALEQDRR